jgi:hypothetical protein
MSRCLWYIHTYKMYYTINRTHGTCAQLGERCTPGYVIYYLYYYLMYHAYMNVVSCTCICICNNLPVVMRTGRVMPTFPVTRNFRSSSFCYNISPAPSPCCFNSLYHWTGTGWCKISTRWKSCIPVRARDRGAWACLAHALQCLCDGCACCPARALQLVICRN